ncbi:MAG: stage II sporulation protein P, partial [Lachnospiraceae bacterium]|nr:stage II sporulation protein P [Lachnospiraceae bacterium]
MLFLCGICGAVSFLKNAGAGSDAAPEWQKHIAAFFNHQMEWKYFQIPRYLEAGKEDDLLPPVEQLMARQFLFYDYAVFVKEPEVELEDTLMAELIGQQEGADEDFKNIDEEHLDYGEDALHIEKGMLEEMERENSLHESGAEENPVQSEESVEQVAEETGQKEFEAAAYPAYTYDWSEKWDYEALVSNFYAVDNSTSLKEEYVNLNALLYQDLTVNRGSDGPQILIYHTHSRESFADSVPGDASTTIVGAGDKLAELLQDKYGFKVLHH